MQPLLVKQNVMGFKSTHCLFLMRNPKESAPLITFPASVCSRLVSQGSSLSLLCDAFKIGFHPFLPATPCQERN